MGDDASEGAIPLPAPSGFWGVEPRTAEDGSPDINFRVFRPNPPQDQRDLQNAVERALTVVKALYGHPDERRKLDESVTKLVTLSQVGLVGPNASPSVAADALRALESDIIEREAGPIKNQYMKRLGLWSALFGGTAASIYLIVSDDKILNIDGLLKYRMLLVVWTGCMAGTWASFATRKVELSFGDLVAIEEDRIEPQLRLLFTGVLTVVLSLIFTTGVADIQIGGFHASSLIKSGSVALLLGAFAGLGEKALPSAVLSRANTVITSIKPA